MRAMARQNLLVAAVNAALEQKLITVTKASFEFTLGGYPVIAYVNDAGFDDVMVRTICRPTKWGRDCVHYSVGGDWPRYGDALSVGRLVDQHLQNYYYHGSRAMTEQLGALVVEPHGFDIDAAYRNQRRQGPAG
jgi:hypothetical protein